jgi:hypothetical protein
MEMTVCPHIAVTLIAARTMWANRDGAPIKIGFSSDYPLLNGGIQNQQFNRF